MKYLVEFVRFQIQLSNMGKIVLALYKPFEGKVLEKSDIEVIQKNKLVIANEITKQIATHYFKEKRGSKKKVVLELHPTPTD